MLNSCAVYSGFIQLKDDAKAKLTIGDQKMGDGNQGKLNYIFQLFRQYIYCATVWFSSPGFVL